MPLVLLEPMAQRVQRVQSALLARMVPPALLVPPEQPVLLEPMAQRVQRVQSALLARMAQPEPLVPPEQPVLLEPMASRVQRVQSALLARMAQPVPLVPPEQPVLRVQLEAVLAPALLQENCLLTQEWKHFLRPFQLGGV